MTNSGLMRVSREFEEEVNKMYEDLKKQGLKISKVQITKILSDKAKRKAKEDGSIVKIDFGGLNIKL